MHVSFYNIIRQSESCRKIRITKEGYAKLVSYIIESFDLDNSGNPILIKGAGYSYYDSFYEAQGSYSMLFTCNTWTNKGLKSADLKACLWTPFDKFILDLY